MNSGDAKSRFDKVYAANFSLIYKVAYGVTSNRDSAEELSQEAFIRYYERIDTLPDGDEALYWLIRVVRNLSYNHEKRRGRETRAYQKFHHEPKKELVNEGERGVLKEETKSEVRKALETLPENLRTVLVMKEYGSMNYKEIGESLGISEGNVKIRVFRARKQLAEQIKKGDVYVP